MQVGVLSRQGDKELEDFVCLVGVGVFFWGGGGGGGGGVTKLLVCLMVHPMRCGLLSAVFRFSRPLIIFT